MMSVTHPKNIDLVPGHGICVSAEQFGPEPFGPELTAEGLTAEGLAASP